MSCDPRIQQAIDLLNAVVTDCTDPMPMPAPAPNPDVLASSVPVIPSNFDVAQYLITGKPIPPSSAPDVVGAFRLDAAVSHYACDDPIVYPNQPGKSHLHEFLGNRSTDNTSTYESMRQNGEGSTEGGPINRSGYWRPALILGGDVVAVPDSSVIYYKRPPHGSTSVVEGATITRIPRGLRMISHHVNFMAMRNGQLIDGKGYRPAFDFVNLLQPGDVVHTNIGFPDLWDGQRVDCADHMSHMAFAGHDGQTGQPKAPAGFTNQIAHIQLFAAYTVKAGDDWVNALYASDKMLGQPLGTTYHGDYMEAWDDDIFDAIEANALDKMLNCSGGQIGDGRVLKRPALPIFGQTPNRIPLADIEAAGKYVMS